MIVGARVRHVFKNEYGSGTIESRVAVYAFVVWDNGNSSMESIQNLELINV